MSYYRYITGVYKSYIPQLNRTLRSRSVPRRVPDLDKSRYTRSTSLPPVSDFSSESFLTRYSATPFRDRAASVPPRYELRDVFRYKSTPATEGSHYTDFDCKVIDYMGKLDIQSEVKSYVSQTVSQTRSLRSSFHNDSCGRDYDSNSFSSRYNYYDGNKHGSEYLYPVSQEVLGNWKHYSLSSSTLKERNQRGTSPLVSRELNRYYGTQKRVDFLGDVSSGGATDFRHYNYRPVPYLGGSDHYKYLPKMCRYLNNVDSIYF